MSKSLQPSPAEVQHHEIGDMEEPAQRILAAMEEGHQRITSGHYRLVVGDDASGRLFGHIFANVIGRIHSLCGHPVPALAFLVGHPKRDADFYEMMNKVASERLSRIVRTNMYSDLCRTLPRPLEPGKKQPQVLVTTDGIQSGTSLIPIVQACKEQDIGLDAAAIRIFGGYPAQKRNLQGVGVYDGEGVRSIYQEYRLIG